MPSIIDRELVGDRANEKYEYPGLTVGMLLDHHLEKNIAELGDGPALVRAPYIQTEYSFAFAKIEIFLLNHLETSDGCYQWAIDHVPRDAVGYAVGCVRSAEEGIAVWRYCCRRGQQLRRLHRLLVRSVEGRRDPWYSHADSFAR